MKLQEEFRYLAYWSKKTDIKGQEGAVGASCCNFLEQAQEEATHYTKNTLLLNVAIVDTHRRLVEVIQGSIGPELLKTFNKRHKGWRQINALPPW